MQESIAADIESQNGDASSDPPVTIYSGHDSTLYALLHALNNELGSSVWNADGSDGPRQLVDVVNFDAEVPPYASTVAIACWRDLDHDADDASSEPYCVELNFNGQTAYVPHSSFQESMLRPTPT